VNRHVPDGGGICVPAPIPLLESSIELIKPAAIFLQNQNVTVSVAVTASFNGCIPGNRIGARITLVPISREVKVYLRLGSSHNLIRNPNRFAVVSSGEKIGMERCRCPDKVDVIG